MAWQYWTTIQTAKDWVYTEPSTAQFFRIKHVLSSPPPFGFIGSVCRANFNDGGVERMSFKRLYPSDNFDTFELPAPEIYSEPRLGIRGQTKYISSINWEVQIYTWIGAEHLV